MQYAHLLMRFQAVLSVLKNRNVQESVEKCDVLIVEGLPAEDGEPGEHVESKFVLRFHCKNGNDATCSAYAMLKTYPLCASEA